LKFSSSLPEINKCEENQSRQGEANSHGKQRRHAFDDLSNGEVGRAPDYVNGP